MVNRLLNYQQEYVDAFKMECSEEDIKSNPDAKKLARYINKQGKRIDKMIKIYRKNFEI